MNRLFFIINLVCLFAVYKAKNHDKHEANDVLNGHVTHPGGTRLPIELGATLTIELRDTSLMDAPSKVIAQEKIRVLRFPVKFSIKYPSTKIVPGLDYSIGASIRNRKNELLYINDVHIGVSLNDLQSKNFINVPVILVKKTKPVAKKTEWPELVGKPGKQAMDIIKKQSGFSNVSVVNENSPITLDYRTDRVRIFVNAKGIVIAPPTIG